VSLRESSWTSRSRSGSTGLPNTDSQSVRWGLSLQETVDQIPPLTSPTAAGRPGTDQPAVPRATALADQLSVRERAILLALDQYRYLDRTQLEALFFPGSRSAQLKLRELALRELVLRWDPRPDGGPVPRPSVYVLSARGAARLSRAMHIDPRPAVSRARRAQTQTYHLAHDVEANGFFARLAADAAGSAEEGLYHWAGESRCRQVSGEHGSPASDGWGRYLLPDRELLFDLEWDRGTEHERRLRQKASAYISYFRGRRGARLRHVLIVAPTDRREAELRRIVANLIPRSGECCRFWTTTVAFVEREGPLGRIWLEIGSSQPGLVAFNALPGTARSNRRVEHCIGKPAWWEHRPGGGEGA
jgi:Replication-relaxation